MDKEVTRRLKLLHMMEQLAEGLDNGDPQCEEAVRVILAKAATSGSCAILSQVIRGIISEWDAEQPQWDGLLNAARGQPITIGETMKVYIYNENCVSAGQSVPQRIVEEHSDPDNGGDWTTYESTEEELIEQAKLIARHAGNRRFQRRSATTILAACCWCEEEIDELIWPVTDEEDDDDE